MCVGADLLEMVKAAKNIGDEEGRGKVKLRTICEAHPGVFLQDVRGNSMHR